MNDTYIVISRCKIANNFNNLSTKRDTSEKELQCTARSWMKQTDLIILIEQLKNMAKYYKQSSKGPAFTKGS